MTDYPRFGPAGVPPFFRTLGAELIDVPLLLHEEGLDAFEYQAVRWGQEPQMKRERAELLGFEAKKNDVKVSLHGSYYVNLAGTEEVIEASKRRLIACANAAQWMGAYVVVFHMGYYGISGRVKAFKNCVNALNDISATMANLGIRNVLLGPETMGKHVQIGSLEEILTICETVQGIQLVIDWGHLHARSGGKLRTSDDFRLVVEQIENRLGTQAARTLHCHFSKIEFTRKGERRHHIFDEKDFGPEFESFAKVISDFGMHPVVICETPLQDVDSVKMRDTYKNIIDNRRQVQSSPSNPQ